MKVRNCLIFPVPSIGVGFLIPLLILNTVMTYIITTATKQVQIGDEMKRNPLGVLLRVM